MSGPFESWLALLLATDAPALPLPSAMQLWLRVGWTLVLVWMGTAAMRRCWSHTPTWGARHVTVAMLILVSAGLPGPYAPAYWLGLAFQGPSVVTVLLCAGLLMDRFAPSIAEPRQVSARNRWTLALAAAGALAGWALLLDTFALLPVQLYAWGFSPAAFGLLLLGSFLPWLVAGGAPQPVAARVAPVALLVFAVWRLPTGNAWDAVLDPWLWVALQGLLLHVAWKRLKA